MSLECSECERDVRGGHGLTCSRRKDPTVQQMVDRLGLSTVQMVALAEMFGLWIPDGDFDSHRVLVARRQPVAP